jgi:hypothetical protein
MFATLFGSTGRIIGSIAVLILAIILFIYPAILWDTLGINSGRTATTFAAQTFGGKDYEWSVVPGSNNTGWVYSGPIREIKIPPGYRADYPGNTCDEPGSAGVFGPVKVTRGAPLTVWHVPGETRCPDTGQQVSPKPQGQPPSVGGQFSLGCGDKDVGAVQNLIGISVVCLGTEFDAYTWRSVPIAVAAICPQGWICTLHLQNDRIVVVQGDGSKYAIKAGTFRRLAGYPEGDSVHNACALLVKEQTFGASQTPSFHVEAGNFSCRDGR